LRATTEEGTMALAAVAENDQLRAAVREALRLLEGGPLTVVCPSCGAKENKPCYGNGPMIPGHEVRRMVARESGINTLREVAGQEIE
jgi:hypothetical protein